MTEKTRTAGLTAAAAASVVGYGAVAGLGPLDERIPELIGIWLTLSLAYLFSVALLQRGRTRLGLGWIWAAALLFRILAWQAEPRLSEDLYRYRWQGMLQAAGGDPYTSRPEEARWESLRDSTYPSVNRKDFASVYGPVLELLYVGAYWAVSWATPDPDRQVRLFRLPFALFDLGVGAALCGLLGALGLARERVLVYLWNPLAVIEFWTQGHNDSLAVLAVVLAVWAATRDRWAWAFAALGFAVAVKFWPVVLVPFFLLQRCGGRWVFRWRSAFAAPAVILLAGAPYWETLSQAGEVLEGFVGGWRNNDSLFGLIWEQVDRDYDRATEVVRLLLPAALAGLWALQLRLTRSALWAPVLVLAFAANCFPWYLTWFLPLLAVHSSAGLLLWTALAPLHYEIVAHYARSGVWEQAGWVRPAEYLPVAVVLVWEGLRARRERRSAEQSELSSLTPTL